MKRNPNGLLWAGFLLSLVAFVSYPLLFFRYPITRDVPWVNFLLFGAAAVLLAVGLRRAFLPAPTHRGRIAGPILTALSVAVIALFCFGVLVGSRRLPASPGAPKVGQQAPEFTLPDTGGRAVSLSGLLAAPMGARNGTPQLPRGVLLVFYRGYW
jgi:hypothetical protein